PRRNPALLAGSAAARSARPDRIDGARGHGRHPALEPRRRADLAPVHHGPTASARLHIRSEPPRSHAFPVACGATLGRGERAKPLCCTVVGFRQRTRDGDRGSALLSRWGRRLLLHGRTLCGWVGGSGGIGLGNRSMEPLALLMRSMGKRDVARSAAAWFPSTAMPPHYRIALECLPVPPHRHGLPFFVYREVRPGYFEHLGWTPSTAWARSEERRVGKGRRT